MRPEEPAAAARLQHSDSLEKVKLAVLESVEWIRFIPKSSS
jgi:hypothetical protein